MNNPEIDAIPRTLAADQIALDVAYQFIKHLPPEHPEVAAYAKRLEAHGNRVIEFAMKVRRPLAAPSN